MAMDTSRASPVPTQRSSGDKFQANDNYSQNDPKVNQNSLQQNTYDYYQKDKFCLNQTNISEELGCSYQKDLTKDLSITIDNVGENRNEFYFETDHDALRGNPDYSLVLKTMAILESQKAQAVRDLEVLNDARTAAIKDPLTLISKLQNGEDLRLPGKQKIAGLPHINWDKYGLASLSQLAAYSIRKPETRKNVSTLINHVGK